LTRETETIDDLGRPFPQARNGACWEFIADRVMGGVSRGHMRREQVRGRAAIRLTGDVSLDNNGGFLQIALDLAPDGGAVDASGWRGLELDLSGNGAVYNLHLRSADVTRPWQSYRAEVETGPAWQTCRLPFDGFTPHRIDRPLDTSRLRRIGLVAIGREFHADVALGAVRFFR